MTEVKFPKLKYPLDTRMMNQVNRMLFLNYDCIWRLLYTWDEAGELARMTLLNDAHANLQTLGDYLEKALSAGDMFEPELDGKDDIVFGEI
jgi:hypothetical protein